MSFREEKVLKKSVISAAIITMGLTGCSNNPGDKETIGTVAGGAAGVLLGSQIGHGSGRIIGGVAGGAVGGFLGNRIGKSMDDQDEMMSRRNTDRALEQAPDYQAQSWRNPNNGHRGAMTVNRTYERNGRPCREYTQSVFIDGREQIVYGEACRERDGTWKVIS